LQFYCFSKFNISLSEQYRFQPPGVIFIKCRGYFYSLSRVHRRREQVWSNRCHSTIVSWHMVDNRKSKSASSNRARWHEVFLRRRGPRAQACSSPICKVQLAAIALVKVSYRLATIA